MVSTQKAVTTSAIAEYAVGLYAGGLFGRIVVPLIALAFTGAFFVGLCDVASGWRLSIPLWAHIVSTLTFSLCMVTLLSGHIRRTRDVGRRFLKEIGRA